jgi:uncharacterized membrane protein
MTKTSHVAERLLGAPFAALDAAAQNVAIKLSERKHISRNLAAEGERVSFGQRAADAVATFAGSWTFIFIFFSALLAWVLVNSLVLVGRGAFDPYPYILLNLFLSMLASIQAPLILMSQNRQAEKDRKAALNDYEVNLKAELEIMLLHEKIDLLRENQWTELVSIQQQQLDLLKAIAGSATR